MGTYRIKNWERFQHYKDRRPPWIKFYTEIIEEFDEAGNVNDLFALSDGAKLTLVLAWALASHFGGNLPDKDEKWFAHRLGVRSVSFKELIDKGFVIASNCASIPASNPATDPLSPEREKELQREVRDRGKKPPFVRPALGEVEKHIKDKGYHFTAAAFIAFYDSKGWKVGKEPMKDWQAACVTWEERWRQQNNVVKATDVKPTEQLCRSCGDPMSARDKAESAYECRACRLDHGV